MQHHSEAEAVDLLMEVEKLELVLQYANEANYEKVCLYLLSTSQYSADTEEMLKTLKTVYSIYLAQRKYPLALRVAQKINDMDMINEVMSKCTDLTTLKQMAFMLGR